MSSFLGVPVDAAYHLVSALAVAFAPLLGGLAAAAAIIAFTMAVRLLVAPLSYYSFRGEKARARLAPRVQELRRRHAHQPERLQRELSTLYQAEGTGMFAGCLPALLQIPFFSVVYRLFLSRTVAGGPNTLLGRNLLWAPLGSHWLSAPGPFSAQGAVFAILFVVLAVLAVFSMRAAKQMSQASGALRPGGGGQAGGGQAGRTQAGGGQAGVTQAGGGQARGQQSGAMQAGGGQAGVTQAGVTQAGGQQAEKLVAGLARFMPFGTVLMVAVVPLAAGLYLLTTAAWTLTERTIFRRAMVRRGHSD